MRTIGFNLELPGQLPMNRFRDLAHPVDETAGDQRPLLVLRAVGYGDEPHVALDRQVGRAKAWLT